MVTLTNKDQFCQLANALGILWTKSETILLFTIFPASTETWTYGWIVWPFVLYLQYI